MTYSEIYNILSFENTKLITTKLLCPHKIKSLSLVVWSSKEPKYQLNKGNDEHL
jgi:hypothetical protein